MSAAVASPWVARGAALVRPLSSTRMVSTWGAWPQQPRQQQSHPSSSRVVAQARNRLQELLEEMRNEEVEDVNSNVPVATKLEWPSPLAVLRYPDPRLRAVNALVGVFDDSLRQLAAEMFEVMYQDEGVGLAAPQVGANLRLMVFNEAGQRGHGEEVVLVNPQVISLGKSLTLFEEGCLSFPNMYANVERPTKLRVKAQDLSGKKFTLNLSGFPARIFQHEYDHLDGRLFHDRMAPPVLAEVRQQLVEMEEAYLAAHPGAAELVQRVPPA